MSKSKRDAMGVRRTIIIVAFLWGMAVAGFTAEPTVNLFPDPDFTKGFRIVDGPKPLGLLRFGDEPGNPDESGNADAPAWTLAQHNSRYRLTDVTPRRTSNGGWEAVTSGMSVTLEPSRGDRIDGADANMNNDNPHDPSENGVFSNGVLGEMGPTLRLSVFAENEYEAPRVLNQPWPHLLVIHDFPPGERISLAGDDPLFFSTDLRIVTCENKMAEGDYQSAIHCGQVSAYFIIRNADPNSLDRDDYIWFGLPIFDSRRDFPPPYAALDGDPAILGTGKLIWLPGGPETLTTLYGGANPRSREWVHLKANLKTYLAEALAEAKRRNFLTHTQTDDLEICHFNLGWEVPGTFHCVMEIRNLRLTR